MGTDHTKAPGYGDDTSVTCVTSSSSPSTYALALFIVWFNSPHWQAALPRSPWRPYSISQRSRLPASRIEISRVSQASHPTTIQQAVEQISHLIESEIKQFDELASSVKDNYGVSLTYTIPHVGLGSMLGDVSQDVPYRYDI
jgi:hypothetical protein